MLDDGRLGRKSLPTDSFGHVYVTAPLLSLYRADPTWSEDGEQWLHLTEAWGKECVKFAFLSPALRDCHVVGAQ